MLVVSVVVVPVVLVVVPVVPVLVVSLVVRPVKELVVVPVVPVVDVVVPVLPGMLREFRGLKMIGTFKPPVAPAKAADKVRAYCLFTSSTNTSISTSGFG